MNNIKDKHILDIWNSNLLKNFREKLKKGDTYEIFKISSNNMGSYYY